MHAVIDQKCCPAVANQRCLCLCCTAMTCSCLTPMPNYDLDIAFTGIYHPADAVRSTTATMTLAIQCMWALMAMAATARYMKTADAGATAHAASKPWEDNNCWSGGLRSAGASCKPSFMVDNPSSRATPPASYSPTISVSATVTFSPVASFLGTAVPATVSPSATSCVIPSISASPSALLTVSAWATQPRLSPSSSALLSPSPHEASPGTSPMPTRRPTRSYQPRFPSASTWPTPSASSHAAAAATLSNDAMVTRGIWIGALVAWSLLVVVMVIVAYYRHSIASSIRSAAVQPSSNSHNAQLDDTFSSHQHPGHQDDPGVVVQRSLSSPQSLPHGRLVPLNVALSASV